MRLYKYFPAERIDVLESGRICFSTPANLNDPFEVKAPMKFFASDDELEAQFASIVPGVLDQAIDDLLKDMPHLSREVATGLVQMVIPGVLANAPALFKAAMPKLQDTLQSSVGNHLGMLCLSETCNDLLMWAHYAGAHTGFMVEFDGSHPFFNQRKSEKDEIRHLRKVEYSDSRPPVLIDEHAALRLFLTKSKHWEYEQEWRMMLPLSLAAKVIPGAAGGFHLFDYPLECIKSVTMGCKMNDADKTRLIDALRGISASVRPTCKQASPDYEHFRINTTDFKY